jgi:hypothetical protein
VRVRQPAVQRFPAGGYRFITHQFQYSGGVAAEPGFRIEHARFMRPVPRAEGFDAIEAYLGGIGRSPSAFCACEAGHRPCDQPAMRKCSRFLPTGECREDAEDNQSHSAITTAGIDGRRTSELLALSILRSAVY